jgi:hypothetical protein
MENNSKRIYIAGPMRGYPYFNFPAFDNATVHLRNAGWEVFNPADKDRELHGKNFALRFPDGNINDATLEGFSLREALAVDTNWICKQANAIYMLKGWEDSGGARAEHALAHALRLEFIYEE